MEGTFINSISKNINTMIPQKGPTNQENYDNLFDKHVGKLCSSLTPPIPDPIPERDCQRSSPPPEDQDLAYRVFESQPIDQLHYFLSCLSESQPRIALLYLLNLNLSYYISRVYPITGDKIFVNTNKNILNKLLPN